MCDDYIPVDAPVVECREYGPNDVVSYDFPKKTRAERIRENYHYRVKAKAVATLRGANLEAGLPTGHLAALHDYRKGPYPYA